MAVVYVAATLMLISVLEVKPEWQHYAPAMFPILAVVGAFQDLFCSVRLGKKTQGCLCSSRKLLLAGL
jgi:hypothetical protein